MPPFNYSEHKRIGAVTALRDGQAAVCQWCHKSRNAGKDDLCQRAELPGTHPGMHSDAAGKLETQPVSRQPILHFRAAWRMRAHT